MDDERDLNIAICKYVYTHWISKVKSQREFASKHEIEESTVRKIKNVALGTAKTDYNISLGTLAKICRKEEMTLKDFFGNIHM